MGLDSISLIAIDLDGTLLRRDGTPSKKARAAVKQLEEMGVTVVIATGRPSTSATRVSEWLGCKGPVIACNGAHVLMREGEKRKGFGIGNHGARGVPAGWRESRFLPIEEKDLRELIALVREYQVYFHLHLRGYYGVEQQYLRMAPKKAYSLRKILQNLTGMVSSSPMKILENGTSPDYAGKSPKVCVDGPKEQVFEVKKVIEQVFRDRLQCIMTGPTFMEIMDARINKGEALSFLGKTLGIPLSKMAALGDGDNDIQMLSAVGVGVAMANASPLLCLSADRFTYSCDEEGVSEFLKEVLAAKVSAGKKK